MPLIKDNLVNNVLSVSAPSRIARGCKLPEVFGDGDNVPYVIASKNPNGVFSIATLGRALGRSYGIPLTTVAIDAGDSDTIGAFGDYEKLIINTNISDIKTVLMQDLADDVAFDITDNIEIKENKIIINGSIIRKIGTSSQPDHDTSEPGVVIKII